MNASRPRGAKNTTLRILISGGLAVGGPQTHLTTLCGILRQAGAEVTIASASTNWTPAAIAYLRGMGVRVIVSGFGFGRWRQLGKLWALLLWPFVLRRDYDVLYCVGEGRMHLWAGRFISRHGWKIYHELVACPAPGSVGAEVAAKMDAIIANSRHVETGLRRLLPAVPLRTLPFLTSSAPAPRPLRRPPVGNGTLRIAFLGRLVAHKRPDLLIESWPLWSARAGIGPARLDLYGGDYDGEAGRLQQRIRELGLGENVKIHGAYGTDDLPRIFAASDLVVLPSLYEGLPLVLVEAMLHGIPVVATSAGGTVELGEENPDVIISNGTDWFHFEAGLGDMAQRLRDGRIDGVRLHDWTESRYGFEKVAKAWRQALLDPQSCFVKRMEIPAPRDQPINVNNCAEVVR